MRREFIGKVTSGYRVVIPKEVRELLEIEEGDLVRIRIKKAKGSFR